MNHFKKAYLIVICDPIANAILRVEIWSSPEWEQSMCLKERSFIAYAVDGETFHEARLSLLEAIKIPSCRYHYLYNIMTQEEKE